MRKNAFKIFLPQPCPETGKGIKAKKKARNMKNGKKNRIEGHCQVYFPDEERSTKLIA